MNLWPLALGGIPVQFSYQPLNGLRCAHCILRVITPRHRSAENCHYAIAEKFIESAAVIEDDVRNVSEIVVQDLDYLLRLHFFAERREVANIGKEHAHFL